MSNSLNLNSAELEGAPVELASQVSAKTSSLLRVLLIVVEMLVATLTTAGNSAPCSSQKILEFEIAYLHFPLHSQNSTKHGANILGHYSIHGQHGFGYTAIASSDVA